MDYNNSPNNATPRLQNSFTWKKLIYVNSNVSLYWYLPLSHKTILKNSGGKNWHITEN